MTYLWLLKYILPFIIGGLLFGGTAWKIQGARLDSAKAKVSSCMDANKSNIESIEQLKKEIEGSNKSCQERLASKDLTIKRLKEIDKLRGKDENNPSSGDTLLDALNGMFSG